MEKLRENMLDLTEWPRRFPVTAKPWLILGKGPSFGRLKEMNTDGYFTCSLNHVVRETQVTLAHIIDFDVVTECAREIYRNARYLAIPYRPHFQHTVTNRTLADLESTIPVLCKLSAEGRLIGYNLSSAPYREDSPVIKANCFSAEAALNLLAESGVRTVRSLGVDGGNRYSESFADLSQKTLLTNGHDSFDKQFIGIAETIGRTGLTYGPLHIQTPIRVFVGADQAQRLPARVLEYSIRKSCSISCDIQPIDNGDVPIPRAPRNRTRTGFSFSRFRIPELCGYQGRGIYLDADMLVFGDLARVWIQPMDGAHVLSCASSSVTRRPPQFSMLLLDCAALDWDVRRIVSDLDEGRYSYEDLLHRFRLVPEEKRRAQLPPEWNSLEHFEEGQTRLLHFTDMDTQPWVTAGNANGHLWYDHLREAVAVGFLSIEELYTEISMGHVSPRLSEWAGLPPYPRANELARNWTPPYKRFAG